MARSFSFGGDRRASGFDWLMSVWDTSFSRALSPLQPYTGARPFRARLCAFRSAGDSLSDLPVLTVSDASRNCSRYMSLVRHWCTRTRDNDNHMSRDHATTIITRYASKFGDSDDDMARDHYYCSKIFSKARTSVLHDRLVRIERANSERLRRAV